MIIGLTVAIMIPKNTVPEPEVPSTEEETEIQLETIDEILDYVRNNESSDVEWYLDKKIKEYTGTELELTVRLIQINFLGSDGQFEKALYLADKIASEDLTDEDKMELYRSYVTIYENMNDIEKMQEYQKKYIELYNKVFSGGVVGD